jgi:DNA (cytosine-5)-methyltransferase 1
MRHGALFNGIGGFQLAAHWMGWENVWHCEIDPFCNNVVKQHFPQSICYEDIKQFDARQWRGSIDIISGGFPCQPFSQAGKRKGTADNRYLWPEMLRVIREVQPRFVVGENVGGLVNWDRGMVFEQVQADLEAEGYESAAFILPACALNAPHRRDRIWFIAHAVGHDDFGAQRRSNAKTKGVEGINGKKNSATGEPCGTDNRNDKREDAEQYASSHAFNERCEGKGKQPIGREATFIEFSVLQQYITDTNHTRLQRGKINGSIGSVRQIGNEQPSRFFRTTWQDFPTQSPVCNRDDGFPGELAGITFSKWRQESIKAAGNAIVPQVAFEIFKAIESTTP